MTDKDNSRRVKKRNDRNILTFYEKLAVIRYHDEQNMSRNSLARMFQCCSTQIRRILEKKTELLEHFATLSEADASIIIEEMTRKRRKFEMSAISFILHQWVERCKLLGLRKSITNDTLKDAASKMAAILNLPSFRPTYRWLNRFRNKYKYDDEDLGTITTMPSNSDTCDLAVEDIIIEYKSYLPSFMQKEISAITSSSNAEITTETPSLLLKDHDSKKLPDGENNCTSSSRWFLTPSHTADESTSSFLDQMTLDNVLSHLGSIQTFAMFNSDFQALELIALLNDHIKSRAAAGGYSISSEMPSPILLSTSDTVGSPNFLEATQYDEIDDIVLIE